MPSQPLYSINDIVYLKASAALGFLESYKVSGILYDSARSRWLYKIGINGNVSGAPITIGDNITLKSEVKELIFTESELIVFCDAIDIQIAALTAMLTKAQTLKAAQCTGTDG